MKSFLHCLFASLAALLSVATAQNAAPQGRNITLVVEAYDLTLAKAAALTNDAQKLANPAGLLAEVRALAAKNLATITRLPAITTRSAQRAVAEGVKMSFVVEPLIDFQKPDLISVNAMYQEEGKQLVTSATVKDGGALFLGSLPAVKPDQTRLVFVTAVIQK